MWLLQTYCGTKCWNPEFKHFLSWLLFSSEIIIIPSFRSAEDQFSRVLFTGVKYYHLLLLLPTITIYWCLVHEVLRKIFGPQRNEISSIVHNKKRSDLHRSHIVRVMKSWRLQWARQVAWMGEKMAAHRIWVGKPLGKRPLEGKRRRRREVNIMMDVRLIGYGNLRWVKLGPCPVGGFGINDVDTWVLLPQC